MTPTVGRIVHYTPTAQGAAPLAGIVSAVSVDLQDVVDLHVCFSGGVSVVRGVGFSPSPVSGCWSWPPKVEAPAPVVPPAE